MVLVQDQNQTPLKAVDIAQSQPYQSVLGV